MFLDRTRIVSLMGFSMATIKDVAKMAGVAPSTVSKYLNGGTVREDNLSAIQSAIAELDYHVNPFARNLKTQRSCTIGVLLPDMTVAFWGNVMTALDRELRDHGYNSLVSYYDSNHGLERSKLQFLLNAGIDGLIYIPENLSADEYYELTANYGIPVVLVDRMIPGVHTDTILTNNTDASYTAVGRILSEGHQRVGIISGSQTVFTAKERLVGYLRALADRNIPYDDTLVVTGGTNFTTGYNGFLQLMSLPNPPTAIMGTNYDITLGVITAARENNIQIPDQVRVVGYDCAEVGTVMTPPMPVVQQPEQEMGRLSAVYVVERLNGCTLPPRMTRLDNNLVP